MYDLMIIGAGPAGLAAAVYTARQGTNTLLVSGDIGGQVNLTRGVENYLGYQLIEGRELIAKFDDQIKKFPIEKQIGDEVVSLYQTGGLFEAITCSGAKFQSRSAILATGKRSRMLNIPGEAQYTGKGVSYCVICDGPLFAGQDVAIIGGGNSAAQAALDMVKIANHVYLISLTLPTYDEVLGEKLNLAKNLTRLTGHRTEKILGNDFVNAIVTRQTSTGEVREIEVSGVFIEVGLMPNSEPVRNLVKLNPCHEVPVSCSAETAIPGLFAAGDVTSIPEKQIVVAAGEGTKAAMQAHRYLMRL